MYFYSINIDLCTSNYHIQVIDVSGTVYLNYPSFSVNYLLFRLIPKVPAGTCIGQHMCDTHLPLPIQLCLLVANRHQQD